MKRFILFWGSVFYPAGGWRDNHKTCDTLEECLKEIDEDKYHNPNYSWYHVVDTLTGKIVGE